MISMLITSLPIFVCSILAVLLGLNLCQKWNSPQFRLLLFMVAATLLYIGHYVFFNHESGIIPVTDTLYNFCNLAVFPLFFIYIEELTARHPDRRIQLLYLLPAFLCSLCVGVLYMLMDATEIAQFIARHLYHDEYITLTGLAWWQGLVHMVVKIVFALEIPPVLIYGRKFINDYHLAVENNYSNTDYKMLTSIKSLLTLLVLVSVISFLCNIIGRYQFVGSIALLAVPSITFSILILLIGHIGIHQQFYIKDIVEEEERADELLREKKYDLKKSISRLIEEEKLYLMPNLKTEDLAKRLNTNRNYIYQAINVEMGVSFSTLINRKRVEYAVRLIDKEPNLQLNDVAMKSGFSSASAFYRNFKLFMDCSPSDYQQKAAKTKDKGGPRPRIELGTKL